MYGPLSCRVLCSDPDVRYLSDGSEDHVLSRNHVFTWATAVCMLCPFGDRTRNDFRVGRDLYRTRVLAPDDVTLTFSVRLVPFITLTEFFSAQWRGVNISSIASFNSYPCGVYDIHGSFGYFIFSSIKKGRRPKGRKNVTLKL